MPTPARMRTGKPVSAGFTLIEIMVVIVLIGILISLALLSVGLARTDKQLQEQITKLSSIIGVVSEEAQMQGRDFGLEFMYGGYRFLEFDPILEVWDEIADDDLLQSRQLEDGMEFGLILEDRKIPLAAEAKKTKHDEESGNRDMTDDYLPHVLIMSSGDISPFELELMRDSDHASIGLVVTLAGEIKIVTDDED